MTQEGEDLTLKGEITDYTFSTSNEITLLSSGDQLSFATLLSHLKSNDTPHLQMIFVLKGRLKCSTVNCGQPMFVFEPQQHNILANNGQLLWSVDAEHDLVCLSISFSFLSRYLPLDHPGYLSLKNSLNEDKPALFFGSNFYITPEINAILNTLKTSPHKGFCGKLFLKSKFLELLMLQVTLYEQVKENDAGAQLKEEELKRMQQVKVILTENIHRQLPLRTLAHLVGTNEFNLKRNFKIAFGTTVYGYLNQYKMEQAKTMLIENDITIAELSGKMGYKYPTHFTSAFKKYFGYLPNKLKSGFCTLLTFGADLLVGLETFQLSFIG